MSRHFIVQLGTNTKDGYAVADDLDQLRESLAPCAAKLLRDTHNQEDTMTNTLSADIVSAINNFTVTPEVRDGQVVGYQVENSETRRIYLNVTEDEAAAKFLAATKR